MPPGAMAANYVIILAAGDSTRMKSEQSKVMHTICGRPMLEYVLETARSLKPKKICLVIGHDRQSILHYLKGRKGLVFAHQKERRGTAHAAQVGLKALGNPRGRVMILSGDVPLLRVASLRKLQHLGEKHPLSLLTAVLPNPAGYGRILRNLQGEIEGIVEEKKCQHLATADQ